MIEMPKPQPIQGRDALDNQYFFHITNENVIDRIHESGGLREGSYFSGGGESNKGVRGVLDEAQWESSKNAGVKTNHTDNVVLAISKDYAGDGSELRQMLSGQSGKIDSKFIRVLGTVAQVEQTVKSGGGYKEKTIQEHIDTRLDKLLEGYDEPSKNYFKTVATETPERRFSSSFIEDTLKIFKTNFEDMKNKVVYPLGGMPLKLGVQQKQNSSIFKA